MRLRSTSCKRRWYEEALASFTQAVSPAAAQHYLAVVLARHGDLAAAETALTRAVELDPQLAESRQLLSLIAAESAEEVQYAGGSGKKGNGNKPEGNVRPAGHSDSSSRPAADGD